jgi:hypothetical protein
MESMRLLGRAQSKGERDVVLQAKRKFPGFPEQVSQENKSSRLELPAHLKFLIG